MRMLDDLRDELDEIERCNEWEFNFVTDIMQRKEENPDYKLSSKQFEILNRIHQQYCKRW